MKVFAVLMIIGVARSRWATIRQARARAVAVLTALIILEEISQVLITTRTFSLQDLSASLAGVLTSSLASVWIVTANSDHSNEVIDGPSHGQCGITQNVRTATE